MTQQPARSTETGLETPGSPGADSGTSGPQIGAERIGSGVTLTEAERQARAAKCECGHRPIWHHDERGCGYYGFSDNRCACLLTSDAVVESLIAARVDAALAECVLPARVGMAIAKVAGIYDLTEDEDALIAELIVRDYRKEQAR